MTDNTTARSVVLAIASWLQVEAAVKEAEAASLRGDADGLEAARRRAHDVLDTHIDLKLEAVTALRLRYERGA